MNDIKPTRKKLLFNSLGVRFSVLKILVYCTVTVDWITAYCGGGGVNTPYGTKSVRYTSIAIVLGIESLAGKRMNKSDDQRNEIHYRYDL